MDLHKLVKIQAEARREAAYVRQEVAEAFDAGGDRFLDRRYQARKISEYSDLEKLNSDEELNKRLAHLSDRNIDPEVFLERIIGKDNLLSINYLKRGLAIARTVCRIAYTNRQGRVKGLGTGFLVSPGLLMTNNHVIGNEDLARLLFAEFEYEEDYLSGEIRPPVVFSFEPDRFFLTEPALDYSLVAVSPRSRDNAKLLIDFGWNRLNQSDYTILAGEAVTIIQHPMGEPKQIALRDNKVIEINNDRLHYETDTDRGSSGSLVLNDQWEVVALHRAGVPRRNEKGEKVWVANQGVLMNFILDDIQKKSKALSGDRKRLAEELLSSVTQSHKETNASYTVPVKEKPLYSVPTPAKQSLPEEERRPQSYEVHFKGKKTDVEKAIRQEFPKAVIEALFAGETLPARSPLKKFLRVAIEDARDLWEVAASLNDLPGVLEVDPDILSRGIEEPDGEPDELESLGKKGSNKEKVEKKYKGITPDWNHVKTKFPEAITYSIEEGRLGGPTGIRIAQIDTGYTGHPKILRMKKSAGYDFLDNDKVAEDVPANGVLKHYGHGTRTASVLIGDPTPLPLDHNNGVFPYVDYIPFRVADSVVILGKRTAVRVANVVLKAIREEEGFDIIVMSMGGTGRALWRVLAKEAYDRGIIWVCAAGNMVRLPNFVVRPASYPGTIAAAASNYQDKPWRWSMRGPKVDITAPGENIYVPRDEEAGAYTFSYGSGTSYAVPHVAGAAALWLNHHREAIAEKYGQGTKNAWKKVEAFRVLIKQTARRVEGWDAKKLGPGILDVEALLKAPLPEVREADYAYADGLPAKECLVAEEKELIHKLYNDQLKEDLESADRLPAGLSGRAKKYLDEKLAPKEESLESISGNELMDRLLKHLEERLEEGD